MPSVMREAGKERVGVTNWLESLTIERPARETRGQARTPVGVVTVVGVQVAPMPVTTGLRWGWPAAPQAARMPRVTPVEGLVSPGIQKEPGLMLVTASVWKKWRASRPF